MRSAPVSNKIKDSTSLESNQRIYDFLKSHPVGVLASVDPDSNPHATAIYFSVDDGFNLFFTTKRDTKKSDNLQFNNRVVLISYEALSQTTVQVTGFAEDITDNPMAYDVFRNTMHAAALTSEAGIPPISKLHAGKYVAYRIKPLRIRMAIFIRPEPGGYDIYETIEFEP